MAFDHLTLDRALAHPGAPSLVVVLGAVERAGGLSPTRTRDLASAIRRIAAALGGDPADIPADPVWLRPRLGKIAPAALGLSPKSWTNLLSDFRAALAVAGVGGSGIGRGRRVILPPEWEALRFRLPDQRSRIGLSRFMQFCAGLGLQPEAVDDAALRAFLSALERAELRKKPGDLVRDTAKLWNAALASDGIGGARSLTVPDRRNIVAFPEDVFPESFREDVERFLARLSCADMTDPDGPPKPLAPSTIECRRGQIWRFASALVHRGRAPETLRSLADLAEPSAAREGLRYFLERNGGEPSGGVDNLVALLKIIVRWHLKADPRHLDEIRAIGRRVAVKRSGMTERNRRRLRQFDDRSVVAALIALPARLEAKAARASSPIRAARLAEAALAIAILTSCPMRIGNLAAISVDRHLVSGRTGGRRIVIPAAEVKNRRELDYPLPPHVAALLDRYLRNHRKVLNPAPGPFLFVHRSEAGPAPTNSLGGRIVAALKREIGVEMNPHLFRHVCAKLFLRAAPGAYEDVRRVLGHSLTSSTIDAYAGFETEAAVETYARILDGLAKSGPKAGPRGRR